MIEVKKTTTKAAEKAANKARYSQEYKPKKKPRSRRWQKGLKSPHNFKVNASGVRQN